MKIYKNFHEKNLKIDEKKFPSNRIRTSDLEITANPLQSHALPTELSTVEEILKICNYEKQKILTKTADLN